MEQPAGVSAASNGEKIMHSTVRTPVRLPDKSRFADWPIRVMKEAPYFRRHG